MRGLLAVAGGLLLAGGCASYQLGPTDGQTAGARTLHVAPFLNETPEARLTDPLTAALRKEFQRDGTYRLGASGEADEILRGTVTQYRRRAQSLAPNDLASGRDYRLEMTVRVTLHERGTGRVLREETVTGSTLIRMQDDLTSTERQAMPLLAADVARRIVSLMVDGRW